MVGNSKVRKTVDLTVWRTDVSLIGFYITLHNSYSELLKYETAKPLLYMMYRTRNRKQLGRKLSEKDISFEVFSLILICSVTSCHCCNKQTCACLWSLLYIKL